MFGLDFAVDLGRWFTFTSPPPNAATKFVAKLTWPIMTDRFMRDMGELQRWEDLKGSTWARKKTDKMLVESGAYAKSWETTYLDAESFQIGTDNRLAVFHEFGTKKMPERSFVWLEEGEIGFVAERLADWIGNHVRD